MSTAPHPLSPTDGRPIQGSAAPLAWSAVPGAEEYRVQVASKSDFENVLFTLSSGDANLLTLYRMLPENGATFFWRVQARTSGGWQTWSESAAFRATTDDRAREEAVRPATALPRSTAAPSTHVESPSAPVDEGVTLWEDATTSRGAVVAVFAIFLLSFLITTILIMRAA